MKLLSDKEFKEVKKTIEMYKDNYNETLEDYYKLNKQFKDLHELLIKFQSKNQKLRNKLEVKDKRLNKAIDYINEKYIFDKDAVAYYISVENVVKLISILKGEE